MFTLRTKEELWNAFESGHYHSNLIKYAKHWHFKMVFSEVELMISVQNTQYCMIRQTGKNEWMCGMYFKTLFTGLFTLVGLIWNLLGFTVFLAQLGSGILCLHKKIYTFSKLTMELFTNNACFWPFCFKTCTDELIPTTNMHKCDIQQKCGQKSFFT